ncbi:MAG: hypothetical protein AAB948_02340, partial [Patescibacteria group bacterium]
LAYIGIIRTISIPTKKGLIKLKSAKDLEFLSEEDSRKKADIYLNDKGVSIKQTGSSFSYNRLQRANLIELFSELDLDNPVERLVKLDEQIQFFHDGKLDRRNRPWEDFFSEQDFKILMEHLMMKSSPNVGESVHQAEFVLEAPAFGISESNIKLFTFDEYFKRYKDKFKIAMRRQWVGQTSNSEHKRSLGLAKKQDNKKWVYTSISGKPRTGWNKKILANKRRTVYFLMIEKER